MTTPPMANGIETAWAFLGVAGITIFAILITPWWDVIFSGIFGFPFRLIQRYWNWVTDIKDRNGWGS